jgi:hypothetical protein
VQAEHVFPPKWPALDARERLTKAHARLAPGSTPERHPGKTDEGRALGARLVEREVEVAADTGGRVVDTSDALGP